MIKPSNNRIAKTNKEENGTSWKLKHKIPAINGNTILSKGRCDNLYRIY